MYTPVKKPKVSFPERLSLKISAVLLFVLLFSVGCQDTKSRMTNFVTTYNRDAAYLTNQFVTSTSAKADYKARVIEIRVVTAYAANDPESDIIKQIMPNMMMELLNKQPLSSKLIDAGVRFEVTYFTDRLSEISVVTIDKKSIEKLNKSGKNTTDNKSEDLTAKAPVSQFDEILSMMNKSLPYTEKSSGITIFKVDQNDMGDLVYHIRAPKALEPALKTKAGIELMKSEILRDGKLSKLINQFKKFQVKAVKYIYYDEKGKQLNDLRLTFADLN